MINLHVCLLCKVVNVTFLDMQTNRQTISSKNLYSTSTASFKILQGKSGDDCEYNEEDYGKLLNDDPDCETFPPKENNMKDESGNCISNVCVIIFLRSNKNAFHSKTQHPRWQKDSQTLTIIT